MIIIPFLPHHLKSVKNHCKIVQFFEIVFGQIVTCQAMALTVFPIILPPWVSDRLPFWGIRNFCIKKAVHWYCTNKPPLRNWRAYFDNPLLFWYNLLLIVASKLWGRWTLEFSGNNFAAYFYWQLHIRYRISYTKSSCISPTKQKEPLTRSEVSGKWKHSHKAAIIMKIALRFRKAIFGAPSGTRTQDPLIKSQLLYQLS